MLLFHKLIKLKYKSFIFSFFLIISSLVSYGYTLPKKINFVIYILEGKDFDSISKNFIMTFFDSISENEDIVLTAIVKFRDSPEIIHFNHYGLLSKTKSQLKDSIFNHSYEHSLKNNFDDIDTWKTQYLFKMKRIFQKYNLSKDDSNINFHCLLDIYTIEDSLFLVILDLLNEFKLLSLVRDENCFMSYKFKNSNYTDLNKKIISKNIQFINQKNKHEVHFQ